MDRVKKIFQSLSKTELRYLKNYLTAFHSKGKNKALEMLEILEKHPDISQAEISKRLYGNEKSKAFIMLKGRLLEKMLETLSLSINFHNNPAFKEDPATSGAIEVIKDIVYSMLLRRRGLRELSEEILQKCVKRAEELGLPELKLQALIYLRNTSNSGKSVVEIYKPAIAQALQEFETDITGVGVFDEFRVLKGETTSNDRKLIAFLEQKVQEVEGRLAVCYGARAHYYSLSLKVQLYEKQQDYERGRAALAELIELVNTHAGFKSRKRLGIPYLQLASVEMASFRFEAAREAAVRAMEIFHPQTQNFHTAVVYRLFACLYAGRLEEAESLQPHIERIEQQAPQQAVVSIVRYLQSCLAYLRGDLSRAGRLLHSTSELFADKEGWNMGLRIYEIMLLIEREELDTASACIETLRKHLGRYDADLRSELIYRYLHLLEKDAFHFHAPSEARSQLLEDIRQQDPWVAVSHEVIKFDTWVRAQLEQRSFQALLMEELEALRAGLEV